MIKKTLQIKLAEHQLDAVYKMKNGCILCGGVGSGKSRTSLCYYHICNGGTIHSKTCKLIKIRGSDEPIKMYDINLYTMLKPKDLYIITTARKRDTKEWEGELPPFLLSTHPESSYYKNKIVVDSWNNIKKYVDVENAFFIFDEQRVVGYGTWTKSFLKICKKNQWVLLSATPGDTWLDYMPVFIANGFYKNKTEFTREHVIYSPRTNFPKVDRYICTGRLIKYRNSILVDMDFHRNTVSHHEDIYVNYDKQKYKELFRKRWNPWEDRPIQNAAELCYLLRKIVNTDTSRQLALFDILEKHPKVIVFYNYDYELELLKSLYFGEGVEVAEWNGHLHQPIPEGDKWLYLVQYNAGAEGWNCITTDTIIFFSQTYSYKVMVQASGRIDRLNTPYTDLYYYHFKSRSGIDLAISMALSEKKKFNEKKFVNW